MSMEKTITREEEKIVEPAHYDWIAAINSGLFAGGILYLLPQGIPWSGISSALQVIMGRPAPEASVLSAILLHLAIALIYSFIIALVIQKISAGRGVALGALMGLPLYFLNYAIVTAAWPTFAGSESRALVTHVLFALFAASVYKGITRRKRERIRITSRVEAKPLQR